MHVLVSLMLAIVLTALATAAISLTVTRAKIFKPVRDWRHWPEWPHELITCPYCFSHWVALTLVWFAIGWETAIEYIVIVFAVVALAAPIQWVIFHSIAGVPETKTESEEIDT